MDGEGLSSQEGTTQGDPLAVAMYTIGTLLLADPLLELRPAGKNKSGMQMMPWLQAPHITYVDSRINF